MTGVEAARLMRVRVRARLRLRLRLRLRASVRVRVRVRLSRGCPPCLSPVPRATA